MTAEQRFEKHVKFAFSKHRKNKKVVLAAALRKYGSENFKIETLVIANNIDYLKMLEVRAIAVFTTHTPSGYNMTDGGDGITGYELTEEDRDAISKAQKKRYEDPEQRRVLAESGLKGIEPMRAYHGSRRIDGMTPYHKNAWDSRARYRSPEHGAKISETVKKAMQRPEVKENIKAAVKKRSNNLEWRSNISKANLGSKKGPASESRKKKIGKAQQAAWADPERRKKRLAKNKDRFPKIDFTCQTCNIIFSVAPWKAKRNPKFCSKECFHLSFKSESE